MAHKTLIGGTTYEIAGGKTLVSGTVYSIDKGKALVGGTAYEIAFSSAVAVKITGSGQSKYCYVTIDSKKYYAATTLELERGTTVALYVGAFPAYLDSCKIVLNGTTVATGSNSGTAAQYSYVLNTSSVTINLGYEGTSSGNTITITTS